MKVSVVVPTYSMDRYEDFCEACDAVLDQTYDDVELVIVVDGNPDVHERAVEDYGDRDDVVLYLSHDDAGPLQRANMGVVQASGDVVAITDDDAVAEPDWVEELVVAFEEHDAIAAGGPVEPDWVAGEADFLPEEFYFLIGASHRGRPKEVVEVRNTFGANLAFDREVYLKLGGIKQGGIDPSQIQGRETEYCARMRREYGQGVIYNPDAVVSHKIYDYRTQFGWLLRRAFWQGYSKRAMSKIVPDAGGEESAYLREILLGYVPGRLAGLFRRPSKRKASQLLTLFALLAVTGFGYLYGVLRWR